MRRLLLVVTLISSLVAGVALAPVGVAAVHFGPQIPCGAHPFSC
jgi:hypothetical protein